MAITLPFIAVTHVRNDTRLVLAIAYLHHFTEPHSTILIMTLTSKTSFNNKILKTPLEFRVSMQYYIVHDLW
jgi:ABC-type anion transport system duplicated permease subunit